MNKSQHPDLVATADLAEHWGVSVKTIHRMVDRGDLTPYLRGPGRRGAYLFRREDVATRPVAA